MNTGNHAGLWSAYLDTIIEFTDPTGVRWRLRSRAADESGADVVPEFLGRDFEVWVITAWNPESRQVSEIQNRNAHEQLLTEIRADGLAALPAVGLSRDRAWFEESAFIVDATRDWALGAGERFAQNAVFRWTPQALEVVGVLTPGHSERPWLCEQID